MGGNAASGRVLWGRAPLGWTLAPGHLRAGLVSFGWESAAWFRDSSSIVQCDSCAWGWHGRGTQGPPLPAAPLAPARPAQGERPGVRLRPQISPRRFLRFLPAPCAPSCFLERRRAAGEQVVGTGRGLGDGRLLGTAGRVVGTGFWAPGGAGGGGSRLGASLGSPAGGAQRAVRSRGLWLKQKRGHLGASPASAGARPPTHRQVGVGLGCRGDGIGAQRLWTLFWGQLL